MMYHHSIHTSSHCSPPPLSARIQYMVISTITWLTVRLRKDNLLNCISILILFANGYGVPCFFHVVTFVKHLIGFHRVSRFLTELLLFASGLHPKFTIAFTDSKASGTKFSRYHRVKHLTASYSYTRILRRCRTPSLKSISALGCLVTFRRTCHGHMA